jgi:hypothetical protein
MRMATDLLDNRIEKMEAIAGRPRVQAGFEAE